MDHPAQKVVKQAILYVAPVEILSSVVSPIKRKILLKTTGQLGVLHSFCAN